MNDNVIYNSWEVIVPKYVFRPNIIFVHLAVLSRLLLEAKCLEETISHSHFYEI